MKKFILLSILVLVSIFSGYSQSVKKVLLEDFTATWTGFATRGFAVRDSIVNANGGNVIPVSLHYTDPLTTTQSEAIADTFGVSGFPTGMVDRKLFSGQSSIPIGTNDWGYWVNSRLNLTPVLSIAITSNYNTNTRLSNVHVKTTFNLAKTGNMKVHLFYVEDSVINFSPTYNQQNYYGNGCSFADPNNPYYNFPCVINGFVFNNLFRYASSPVKGTGGIIPYNVAAGDTFSVNYAYTLPLSYNANKMKLVAFVSTSDNSVLNAESVPMFSCNCNLAASTVITHVTGPNCINGKIKVTINGTITSYPRFELYDAIGNLLSLYNAPVGTTTYTFTNLTSGTYTVKVIDANGCCEITAGNKTIKCPAPSGGFISNNISATSAKVNWNVVNCNSGYQVQYRILGTTTWTTKTTTNTNRTLNGLMPSTIYQWKVATKCPNANPAVYSSYSAIQTFTTPALREGVVKENDQSELSLSDLILYPNPVTDQLNLSFKSRFQVNTLLIVNMAGQIVLKKKIESEEAFVRLQLETSNLTSGIYALVLSNEEAIQTQRFVKE